MNRLHYKAISMMLLLNYTVASAQFISEVAGYTPAPGQFTNTIPWGVPSSTSSIVGTINGSLCLGSFGGYVVFRFENPVENHPENPYGVDFTIFGNPLTDWAEPGIVWVMKDENNNGLPDDTWYELAGSDYHFSSSHRNYEVTYTNPREPAASDVPWIDNAGNSGSIVANSIHLQPYYPAKDSFPSVPEEAYTLSGSTIEAVIEKSNVAGIKSIRRAFGYADNQLRGTPPYTIPDNPYTDSVEYSGGDAFDIDWAVDQEGEYVGLDVVHFVKVQNAVHNESGFLGELSTEVTGAVDVVENGSISGELDMIVIRDLPLEIESPTFQLEAYVFHGGRVQSQRPILWTCNLAGARVNEQQLLSVHEPGQLILTASLADRPEINKTVSTVIKLNRTRVKGPEETHSGIRLYPNPAEDHFMIDGIAGAVVSMFDAAGKCCLQIDPYEPHFSVDLTALTPGWYTVRIDQQERVDWLQLLKN